jgi:hypothetical protein
MLLRAEEEDERLHARALLPATKVRFRAANSQACRSAQTRCSHFYEADVQPSYASSLNAVSTFSRHPPIAERASGFTRRLSSLHGPARRPKPCSRSKVPAGG